MIRANDIQHGGNHYKKAGNLQHWDLVARNKINYLEGCASKYVSRWRDKNGLEDLNKAGHYVDKALELCEEMGYQPGGFVPDEQLEEFCLTLGLDNNETGFLYCTLRWRTPEDLRRAHVFLDNLKEEALQGK